jgi:hypothetical protein
LCNKPVRLQCFRGCQPPVIPEEEEEEGGGGGGGGGGMIKSHFFGIQNILKP